MDKREQREKRLNIILVITGILLALFLIVFPRGGFSWASAVSWSKISILQWVSIACVFCISLVAQYFLLMLLRYSFLKYLVLWFIPVIWIFNNGLVALHRFLDWTTDIVSPAGWIPVTDLLSWLSGVIFFPVLLGFGVIAAIIDVSSNQLTQACYYANIAMDVANISPWHVIDYVINFINVFWDLVSNSFVQEIIKERSANRSFFDLSILDALSLPQWFMNVGYSFTCILS